jgi:hypothetical protein
MDVINANSQIIVRLTPSNYPQWIAQFDTILIRYDLH